MVMVAKEAVGKRKVCHGGSGRHENEQVVVQVTVRMAVALIVVVAVAMVWTVAVAVKLEVTPCCENCGHVVAAVKEVTT